MGVKTLLRRRALPATLAAGFGVVALLGAYASEIFLNLEPCAFCIYQRWPHFLAALCGVASFFLLRSKFFPYVISLSAIIYLVGAGIAVYHVGVEQGIVELSAKCDSGDDMSDLSFEEMTQAVFDASVARCDLPAFMFAGLSMAAWNAIFSGLVGVVLMLWAFICRRCA